MVPRPFPATGTLLPRFAPYRYGGVSTRVQCHMTARKDDAARGRHGELASSVDVNQQLVVWEFPTQRPFPAAGSRLEPWGWEKAVTIKRGKADDVPRPGATPDDWSPRQGLSTVAGMQSAGRKARMGQAPATNMSIFVIIASAAGATRPEPVGP